MIRSAMTPCMWVWNLEGSVFDFYSRDPWTYLLSMNLASKGYQIVYQSGARGIYLAWSHRERIDKDVSSIQHYQDALSDLQKRVIMCHPTLPTRTRKYPTPVS